MQKDLECYEARYDPTVVPSLDADDANNPQLLPSARSQVPVVPGMPQTPQTPQMPKTSGMPKTPKTPGISVQHSLCYSVINYHRLYLSGRVSGRRRSRSPTTDSPRQPCCLRACGPRLDLAGHQSRPSPRGRCGVGETVWGEAAAWSPGWRPHWRQGRFRS